MHSAVETAAVVDIRTVLHQLGRQQMTAIRVMRVGLVLRAVQAVSAQVSAAQVGTRWQTLERDQRLATALHATLVDMGAVETIAVRAQAHVRVDATRLTPRARVLLRQTALHAMLVATVQRVGSRLHAVVTVG